MTWLYLAAAILFEVSWAIAMKLSDGLTKPLATAIFFLCYLLSAIFLALATRKLDVGTAYGIWAGSGVALIALVGIFHFKEPATALRLISLTLVLLGVMGLKLTSR